MVVEIASVGAYGAGLIPPCVSSVGARAADFAAEAYCHTLIACRFHHNTTCPWLSRTFRLVFDNITGGFLKVYNGESHHDLQSPTVLST